MVKRRVSVPEDIAAEVLFAADRACCVCRDRSHPVQIHHIDEDPSNNSVSNLAVLCLSCHNQTQLQGGFGRHLSADQVRLYRDDWNQKVQHTRVVGVPPLGSKEHEAGLDLRLATTLPEIYKEEHDLHSLIRFYHSIGNVELRDRHIAELLAQDHSASVVTWVAFLQGRSEAVPAEVYDEALADDGIDYMVETALLSEAGRHVDATKGMLRGILRALDEDNLFNAAYNMRRLNRAAYVSALFKQELRRAADAGDLYRQFRCLEELEWHSEAKDLLLGNEQAIRKDGSLLLKRELARAQNDAEALFAIEKEIAHVGVAAFFGPPADVDQPGVHLDEA
jgi:hypothetical protein